MNQDLVNSFVNTLIAETINGFRHWYPLYHQSDIIMKDNKNLYNLLIEFEFHRVKYEDSFYLKFKNGHIYLIHEWCESGRDGTIFDGYNLYIQPNNDSDITLIISDSSDLYRLKNAIIEKSDLPENVTNFITEFLEA